MSQKELTAQILSLCKPKKKKKMEKINKKKEKKKKLISKD
jgi:hypothetical protein